MKPYDPTAARGEGRLCEAAARRYRQLVDRGDRTLMRLTFELDTRIRAELLHDLAVIEREIVEVKSRLFVARVA